MEPDMTTLATLLADQLHAFNLHAALYTGFGAHLCHHALLLKQARKLDAAREHGLHGLVYLALGLL